MRTHTTAIRSIFAVMLPVMLLGATLSFAGGYQEPPCDVPKGDDSCWPFEVDASPFVQWSVDDGGNDNWYSVVVFEGPTPWWQANRVAQLMGGYLAKIGSIGENNHVYYLSLQAEDAWSDCFGPWLGLFRCPPAGGNPQAGWKWCNSTMDALDFSNDYENFPPGALSGATVLSWRTCLDGSNGHSSFWRATQPTPQGGSMVRSAIVEMDMLSMADCNGNGIPDSNDILDGEGDVNGNLVPDDCDCLSDINGDQTVGVDDLLIAIGAWDHTSSPGHSGDVNWDGTVDVTDILTIIDAYGACGN